MPFTHTPAVPDRRLEAKLRDEAPAILRWMIEGVFGLGGRGPSQRMGRRSRPAGGRWRAPATPTSPARTSWDSSIAEWCDLSPTCLESSADLFAAWCAFARTLGEPPGTQRRLAARLGRHGLTREHLHHARVYRGVRLLREGERFAAVREARMGGMRG